MDEKYYGAWAEPKPTDWIVGGETAIKYQARVPNWAHYLPTEEKQRNPIFDSNMCVTYSGLNSLETQLIYLMSNGLLPATQMSFLRDNGYLDENGRPNFNEAFCAKLNGTTINGNHLGAFWDGVRNYGAIPQSRWKDIATAEKWEDLMVEIPQELLDLGKKFKEMFEINYEWVVLGQPDPEMIAYQVKHAPLQIAAPVCQPWNTDQVINVCASKQLQHATMIYGANELVSFMDFDHYNPFRKLLAWDYYLPYAIKGIITHKVVANPQKPTYKFTKTIKYGERSDEVKHLQEALKYLGYFKHPIATGYYGPNTQDAVRAFQYQYQLDTPHNLAIINGMSFGPKSRAKMNALLA